MGVRKALLDTNILIDYLAGIAQARAEMERYAMPAISIITWIEVMAGATPDDEFIEFLGADDVGDAGWWEFLKKTDPHAPSSPPPPDSKQ